MQHVCRIFCTEKEVEVTYFCWVCYRFTQNFYSFPVCMKSYLYFMFFHECFPTGFKYGGAPLYLFRPGHQSFQIWNFMFLFINPRVILQNSWSAPSKSSPSQKEFYSLYTSSYTLFRTSICIKDYLWMKCSIIIE